MSQILDIAQSCHRNYSALEGPYWGDGALTGRRTSSQMDGHWVSSVFDPGGGSGPGGSYDAMNIAIDLEVHLVRQ